MNTKTILEISQHARNVSRIKRMTQHIRGVNVKKIIILEIMKTDHAMVCIHINTRAGEK